MACGSSGAADLRLQAAVRGFLGRHLPGGGRIAVALSGGVDSVVLTDLLDRAARQDPRLRLSAVHVDHGISPRSGDWADFCRRMCERRGLPLAVVRARLDPGRSALEERARNARRDAFAGLDADFVALAHHRDDQMETFVLRALRGSGLRGLACMSARSRLRPGSRVGLLRPLLRHTREEIRAHAEREGLEWVEDEANRDDRFARNLVRNRLLPLAAGRFPDYRESLDASMRSIREAGRLLRDLAALDHRMALQDGGWSRQYFREAGEARTANWLRHVMEANGAGGRTWRWVAEAARQVALPRGQGRRVSIDAGEVRLAAHGDRLWPVAKGAPAMPRDYREEVGFARDGNVPCSLGRLGFVRDDAAGLGEQELREGPLELRAPAGGERLSPGPARPRRRVRDLLREAGVPPWARAATPLLYVGGDLAAVPGVAVSARHRAPPGGPGYFPAWEPSVCASPSAVRCPSGRDPDADG